MKLQVRIRSILFNFFSIFYFGKEKKNKRVERGFRFNDRRRFTIVENEFFFSPFCFVSFLFFLVPHLSFIFYFFQWNANDDRKDWMTTYERRKDQNQKKQKQKTQRNQLIGS